MSYNDILTMPTYERRFFIGLLTKQTSERQEQIENNQNKTVHGKGERKTTVSGDALKHKLKSGDIPLN